MSVSGLCEVCTKREVNHSCPRCGKLVCDKHFEEDTGWCVDCTAEIGRGGGDSEREDMPDGVDTYEF